MDGYVRLIIGTEVNRRQGALFGTQSDSLQGGLYLTLKVNPKCIPLPCVFERSLKGLEWEDKNEAPFQRLCMDGFAVHLSQAGGPNSMICPPCGTSMTHGDRLHHLWDCVIDELGYCWRIIWYGATCGW